ncbi:class III extradiol dioxygenase subunit B-like domain-containing protein [Saccharopolyspora rosea]|uniref:Class III extradiol dioxygenase subunit B-like domain-containing protein n=1 Tax=Saccharopolyspora rosea TaxID=524884 RepID=A0ABW3FSH1_9PSEU|nr:class III extradiol dioxygenase subunit B-like domain-containing protein [Saccharopolyspora rosea]
MITRVAVVPYPPLLVPELTVRPGAETEQLRNACSRAVSSLTDAAAEWVAVGTDPSGPRTCSPDTLGTFAGFGVDVRVTLGAGTGEPDPALPLPALVAGWLREQAGARSVTAHLLAPDTSPEECRRQGRRLERDSGADPLGLLVLADGTNRSDESSPYAPDPRARPFDDRLRTALADADPTALLALDPAEAAELGVAGRAALQVLAGAVEEAGGTWTGELLHSATPYGVTYHVAQWRRTP